MRDNQKAFEIVRNARETAFNSLDNSYSLEYLETLRSELKLFLEETNRIYRAEVKKTYQNNYLSHLK